MEFGTPSIPLEWVKLQKVGRQIEYKEDTPKNTKLSQSGINKVT